MEFSTGCYLVDENVYASSAGATLKNYGMQTIGTTNVVTLPAPEDGSIVDLLFYNTTKQMVVKTTGALFNRQATQDVFTVTLSSAASKGVGHHVRLIGDGTTGWWMLTSLNPHTTAVTNTVALAAAT
jgi:hypothetical protein